MSIDPFSDPDFTVQDARRVDIQEAVTMLGCPYYRGEGKCETGCYSEPVCITDALDGDWTGVLIEAEREEPGSVLAALEEPLPTLPVDPGDTYTTHLETTT
jgi:hypothetical protein